MLRVAWSGAPEGGGGHGARESGRTTAPWASEQARDTRISLHRSERKHSRDPWHWRILGQVLADHRAVRILQATYPDALHAWNDAYLGRVDCSTKCAGDVSERTLGAPTALARAGVVFCRLAGALVSAPH